MKSDLRQHRKEEDHLFRQHGGFYAPKTAGLAFTAGRRTFEVRPEKLGDTFRYAGYIDGERAVSALNAASAVRLLIDDHIRPLRRAAAARC